jgi:serine protease Do
MHEVPDNFHPLAPDDQASHTIPVRPASRNEVPSTAPRRKDGWRNALTIGAIVAALATGYLWRGTQVTAQPESAQAPTKIASEPVVQGPATDRAATMQSAFAAVAKAVEPAVVTITTEKRIRPASTTSPAPDPFGNGNGNDPFEEFFKRFRDFGFKGNSYTPQQKEQMRRNFYEVQGRQRGGGLGSGMIYRNDGLILTNAHVVAGADTLTVKLNDGREFKGKVVGVDERTDVAVVKIPATNLPTVKFGDPSKIEVGDWAIAVGNPFGLEHTVTVGVISAKAREVPLNQRSPGDYLQTDASINPGNSGGPLLDIYARVIGINNAIFSESGGNIGIGFAIPIDTARDIADRLVKDGKIRRGYLGVKISDMDKRAAAFGLDPSTKGVLVEEVTANTPGARAGLQPGDVVVEFNGKSVSRSSELQRLVGNAPVGSAAQLKVLRAGKETMLTARLDELKDETASAESPTAPTAPEDNDNDTASAAPLGLKVSPVTPQLTKRFNLKSSKGLVIVSVEPNSPSADAGLRPGDVIERVAQTEVSSAAQLQSTINGILGKQSNGDDKSVALYVNSRGERRYVVVTVEK